MRDCWKMLHFFLELIKSFAETDDARYPHIDVTAWSQHYTPWIQSKKSQLKVGNFKQGKLNCIFYKKFYNFHFDILDEDSWDVCLDICSLPMHQISIKCCKIFL